MLMPAAQIPPAENPAETRPAAPVDLAIIMPVYGQGPLLCESIGWALGQDTRHDVRIVLVDDCCPEPETVETCRRFARAHPDRIVYWRSPENRGLAAMRNAGAALALDLWPDLFALVSFDGDDRLHPRFAERAVNALREAIARHDAPDWRVGWVFEDPDHFGQDGVMLRTHRYSALWSMAGCANCPTSIVTADLHRAGLRFHENMRHGSEDWQFWLQCLAAGFRGVYRPHIGFRYRRRPGSMSAGALGLRDRNRAQIRRLLPGLFHPDFFAAEEARELPRHAFFEGDGVRVAAHAADRGETFGVTAFARRLSAFERTPTASIPQYAVFAEAGALRRLAAARALDTALWRLQAAAGRDRLATLAVEAAAAGAPLSAGPAETEARPAVMLLSVQALIDRARGRPAKPQAAMQVVRLPAELGGARGAVADPAGATTALQAAVARLRDALPPLAKGRADVALWRPFGLHYTELSDDLLGLRVPVAGHGLGARVLIATDAAVIADPAFAALAERLIARITPLTGAAPGLLVVGAAVPARLARCVSAVHLVDGKADALGRHHTADPDAAGIVAAYGATIALGSSAIVPALNQARGMGRRILGVPAAAGGRRSPLQRDLTACFKVFAAVLAESPDAAAACEAHGVAPEQMHATLEQFVAAAAPSG